LARSQTGITKNQKALGQELNIDHLFYVNMTAAPRLECKTEIITNYRQVKKRIKTKDGIVEISEIVPTKEIQRILYLTIFLEATLVNIETGHSISSSSQEPYVLSGFVGNPDCPSELVAFNEAIKIAAKKIADRLSPRVEIIPVPLEKKDPSISVGNKKLVNQLLEDGVKWLESGNVEEAIKSWQLALEESEGTSKSAYWNIAVAMWYQGELEQAQKYFDQAMKLGGSDFFDSSKRKFYTIFKQEKKRIEEEED
jgi:tetratricopeptide (TPR) repeat protein